MARILSFLFHPLFAPLLTSLLVFNLPIYINFKFGPIYFFYIGVIIFMNLIAAPLLVSIYLKKIGMVETLHMKNVDERKIPYFICSIFYAFTYFLLAKIDFPSSYLVLFGAASISVIILFLASLAKLKISAHLTALGGVCGMLIFISVQLGVDLSNWLIAIVLISGLVASARLSLSAHKPWEVLSGFGLGIACQLVLLV